MVTGIECGKPVGVYSPVRDSYPVGSRVIYQCDEDSNGSTTSERVCHSDGTWSPAAGCMRTDTGCPQPDTPLNGNLSWIRSAWDFPKIRFTCHEGYRLSKDAEAECKNGKWLWKGGPPKCQRNKTLLVVDNDLHLIRSSKQESSVLFRRT